MKHTDTPATLALIDATLRLTEPQLWHDPEFLTWEAGQVHDDQTTQYEDEDFATVTIHWPGNHHWLRSGDAEEVGLCVDDTIRPRPLIELVDDHPARCDCESGEAPRMSGWMLRSEYDYPPPGETVHGPLLLGPEPK